MKWVTPLAVLGSIIVIAALVFFKYVEYNNLDVTMRNQANAEQKVCEVTFDETWKVIQQQFQITDKYKESFKEIFIGMTDKRYGDNEMWKWVQEQQPNFDASLYKSVMNTVDSKRVKFANAQKKLIDIKRQHDDLRLQIPSAWFLSGRAEIKIQLVTSAKTDEAFKSGQENDITLK